MDRKYVATALVYAIVGLLLGIYMAASHNHGQFVTHAHIMLLGFVVTFVYGLLFKLWLGPVQSRLAQVQFYVHQLGTLGLLLGLFLAYGHLMDKKLLEPVLGVASILVLAGMVLMTILFAKSPTAVA